MSRDDDATREDVGDSSEEELQARVAWYYFVGGRTQQDIANELGTSRVRVNRLLAASRESGQVGITVNSELASCVALEHALIEGFGLREAVVVPTPEVPDQLREALGVAAASHLAGLIRDGMTVALGWGRTMGPVIGNLPARHCRNLSVVCLQGGLAHCLNVNTFEVVADMAALYDADQHFFAAPLYVSDEAARDRFLDQHAIRETCNKARQADLALLTAGDMDHSLVVSQGVKDRNTVAELKAAGAVGDVLGYFLDADGRLVDHPLNRRTVALPLADLATIQRRVMISGGAHRVAITRAVMRGGVANVLVTDEATAVALTQ